LRFTNQHLLTYLHVPPEMSFLQLTIVYHPTFFVAFNSVYHKTVVLRTHLLIRKTILFIYYFFT